MWDRDASLLGPRLPAILDPLSFSLPGVGNKARARRGWSLAPLPRAVDRALMSYTERREARNIGLLPPQGWTWPVLNGALQGPNTAHRSSPHVGRCLVCAVLPSTGRDPAASGWCGCSLRDP